MQEILFLKGIPASGKSTFAINFCNSNPNYKRINKDEIRIELGNPPFSREFEAKVLDISHKRGIKYLLDGFSLIVDDTNIHKKHWDFWSKKASELAIPITEKLFDIPVDVCIARDKSRQNQVGEAVILSMFKQLKGL